MTARHPVSLHISLAPRDLRHAQVILAHQMRQLAPFVTEVVLTIDTLGRAAEEIGPDLPALEALASQWQSAAPHFHVRHVDYSSARRKEVSARFFQSGLVPRQTYRVGPFHAYFDGWLATTQPYVFHLDSDMFIGGAAGDWIGEAIALLRTDSSVFTCTPLAGPPRPDLSLQQPSRSLPNPRGAHALDTVSTRIFFIARERLLSPHPRLPLQLAHWRGRLHGWMAGTSGYALPETILSEYMRRLGLHRVDFLGAAPGCWSLHPPFRNPEFYRRLEEIVRRVESDDLPAGQQGDYDLNESVIDWSDARAAIARNRWWRRLWRRT